MNNLSPERKKDLEEFQGEEQENSSLLTQTYYHLGQGKEGGNIYFKPQTVDESQLIDWEEHVKTLDKNLSQLQIIPNKFKFKDNKLVIIKEQFPNLKFLYACGLGLKKIELNHDGLEGLYLINNKLKELDLRVVSNLKQLIISHNSVNKLITEKCPQLSIVYDYKSGDHTRQAPADAKEYNEERDNPIKQEQEKENKILAQIILLFEQAEFALKQKDYPKLEQIIQQMKELATSVTDSAIASRVRDRINKFEKSLLTQQNTSNKKPWPLIISSIIIIPIILGIFVLLAKKWISNKN